MLVILELSGSLRLHHGLSLLCCLFLVNFSEFFCLFERFPTFSVALRGQFKLFKFGHDLTDCGKERRQDEADKAGLALRDLGRLPVAQERDCDALILLDVSLVEKLFKQKNGPLNCDFERPCLCGDIGRMNSKLKQLLLSVELLLVRFSVNQQFTVLTTLDTFLLEECSNFGQVSGVASHICGQNDANKALAEGLEVVSGEVFEKVVLLLVEESERLGRMVVLLHTLVAVANCSIRHLIHMEGISEPIVAIVMAYGADTH